MGDEIDQNGTLHLMWQKNGDITRDTVDGGNPQLVGFRNHPLCHGNTHHGIAGMIHKPSRRME